MKAFVTCLLGFALAPAFALAETQHLVPVRKVPVHVLIQRYIHDTDTKGVSVGWPVEFCKLEGQVDVYDPSTLPSDVGYYVPEATAIGECEGKIGEQNVIVKASGDVFLFEKSYGAQGDLPLKQFMATITVLDTATEQPLEGWEATGYAATRTMNEVSLTASASSRKESKEFNHEDKTRTESVGSYFDLEDKY